MSSPLTHLLLVEDDARVARQVASGLREAGYAVDIAATGEHGLRAVLEGGPYAALVLDILLPGFSGLELVRALRERDLTVPILLLSALDATETRVHGLNLGADDYLVKPFAFSELLARLRALLRRGRPGYGPEPDEVHVADLTWRPQDHHVSRAGQRLDLTARELALAELLLADRGEVVTRAQIARSVWDLAFEPSGNVLDVQVRRLRLKLDDPFDVKLVHTVRGAGYVLEDRG